MSDKNNDSESFLWEKADEWKVKNDVWLRYEGLCVTNVLKYSQNVNTVVDYITPFS